jgi:hypothetical protein
MSSPFSSWRTTLIGALLAGALGITIGCSPTQPATKVPDVVGDKEQIPTPPKRDPG